jgi:hypothetical protein
MRKNAQTMTNRSPIPAKESQSSPKRFATSNSDSGKLKSRLLPICELKKTYVPIGNERSNNPKITEISAE